MTHDHNLTGGANLGSSVQRESFPESYEGSWRCESVVTDSAVASVTPGQKVICEVQFVRDAQGKVLSSWNQDGWAEGQSSVIAVNNLESQMDRTSYCTEQGSDGMWSARARGNYIQINGAVIIARSVVDQYMDGQYLGRYHTTSILHRENLSEGMAASNEEERDFIDQSVKSFSGGNR